MYRQCVKELYTWSLHNILNKCHPIYSIKIKKKTGGRKSSQGDWWGHLAGGPMCGWSQWLQRAANGFEVYFRANHPGGRCWWVRVIHLLIQWSSHILAHSLFQEIFLRAYCEAGTVNKNIRRGSCRHGAHSRLKDKSVITEQGDKAMNTHDKGPPGSAAEAHEGACPEDCVMW